MKDKSHDEAMAEFFAQDSDFAIQYLNKMLEDEDPGDFLTALRQMAIARGEVSNIEERVGLNPTELRHIFFPSGNPKLRSLRRKIED